MINADSFNVKDVVYVKFPYEEDPSIVKLRPALIIQKEDADLMVLVVKITKTPPRDSYDYEIVDWVKANLKYKSTARASKLRLIGYRDITRKIGTLTDEDYEEIILLVKEHAEAT